MSTTTHTFTVVGMTCGHCVNAVTEEVTQVDNVREVDVDLETGRLTVVSAGDLDAAAVRAAVDEAGYEVGDQPAR
jgi:copper chaperone